VFDVTEMQYRQSISWHIDAWMRTVACIGERMCSCTVLADKLLERWVIIVPLGVGLPRGCIGGHADQLKDQIANL
jgi:hypothetical protein